MKRLNVLVWGLGRHALNRIIPSIISSPELNLVGVLSRDVATVEKCASLWNCMGWTDPASALESDQVDAVYVATPIGLHGAHGKRVLDAGKHLWCEKPLTTRLEETHALVEEARARSLSLCEGFMYLYHPQFHDLAGRITGGHLGRIKSITCRFGIPRLDHPGFRSDPCLGGGAFWDVGSYAISALVALAEGQHFEVKAATIEHAEGSQVDTEGWAIVKCSGGATAILEWRINCAYRNEIDVWGANGSLFSDRIFSKSAHHVPEFRIRDAHGLERFQLGTSGDHFKSMLSLFHSTTLSREHAERERSSIMLRAQLLHDVVSAAGHQFAPLSRPQVT